VAGTLRVLRISHSSVVAAWRERERWLRAFGAEVDLVTARTWAEGGATVNLEPLPGERVRGIATLGHHPCGFLYGPFALLRALRTVRHDILDLHEEPYSVAAAEIVLLRWMARQTRAPLVFYTAQNLRKRHPFPVRVAERTVLASARGAYPCNEAAAANLRAKGFNGVVRVVPLGVAPPSAAEAEGERPSGFCVGCAGRLTVEKGFQVVVDVLSEEPTWSLRVAGDGPAREELVRQAKRQGVAGRVEFLGHCGSAAMAAFYRSIDVLAVPSLPAPGWQEQFGRVAVEAMAAGVPVVASASGSLPEVVGDAGLLVPPGDAGALHEALATVASDRSKREELIFRGLKRSRSYNWESVARQQLALYRSVLAERPEGPHGAATLPSVHAVIVAYGRPDLVASALGALGKTGEGAPAAVVVDNSSSGAVREVAASAGASYLDPGRNLGFGAAVNLAVDKDVPAGADVLLLNPDAEIDASTVHALQARLHGEARLACVAPAQVDHNGRPQRVAWPFPSPALYWLEALGLGGLVRVRDFLVGSVLLVNGKALKEVGGFDESFFLYAEETDWQRRAREAGWGARLCADLHARHIGAATSANDPAKREAFFAAGQERYIRKWYGPGGWALTRAAVVAGALARAAVLRGERRQEALGRAWRFAVGPSRVVAAVRGEP
jgi:glycosyltransferase involved in cell wall biosynthesis/GT2 family glycosyltransferase